LDIMRRRSTVLLKGASVRPGPVSTHNLRSPMATLTSQELVQTHQQLDVGVGGLGDLCSLVNPRTLHGSCCVWKTAVASALLRRLDGDSHTAVPVSNMMAVEIDTHLDW
jgi:hypothetical protein